LKANGHHEISDVPTLLKRGDVLDLIQARGALLDAAEQVMEDCERSGRAMTLEERSNVEEYTASIAEISAELTAYKVALVGSHETDLPAIFPF
jgi:hypothetical protein